MEDQTQKPKKSGENMTAEQTNIVKLTLITLGSVLVLAVAVYAAYSYARSREGGIVLPGGTTYLGASPTPQGQQPAGDLAPTTPPLRFTADTTVPYKEYFGTAYPFSFSYPETLSLVTFPDNPPMDTIAIAWGKPPQQNILLNIEILSERDKTYIDKSKQEFVENWWKFFTGLKGVAQVTPFTNVNGMKGYKAQYINWANESPNVDVFFEVPGRSDIMIHLANGILDQTIFDRIVDSLKWNTPTPSV